MNAELTNISSEKTEKIKRMAGVVVPLSFLLLVFGAAYLATGSLLVSAGVVLLAAGLGYLNRAGNSTRESGLLSYCRMHGIQTRPFGSVESIRIEDDLALPSLGQEWRFEELLHQPRAVYSKEYRDSSWQIIAWEPASLEAHSRKSEILFILMLTDLSELPTHFVKEEVARVVGQSRSAYDSSRVFVSRGLTSWGVDALQSYHGEVEEIRRRLLEHRP